MSANWAYCSDRVESPSAELGGASAIWTLCLQRLFFVSRFWIGRIRAHHRPRMTRTVTAITKSTIWVRTVNRFTVAERALTVSVAAHKR